MVDAQQPPSRPPWDEPRVWQARPQFQPLYYLSPAPSSAGDVLVAVMPVPVHMVCIAFRSPEFLPVLAASTALQAEDVWLMLPSEADLHALGPRRWGSVVMRGSKQRVDRGREAVIWLMDSGNHMLSSRTALPELQRHMKRWTEAEAHAKNQGSPQHEAAPAPAAAAAEAAVTPASSDWSSSSPSPSFRPAVFASPAASVSVGSAVIPCPWHMRSCAGGSCGRPVCSLSHASYPELFMALCQHAPLRIRQLPWVTPDFAPVLCLSAPHLTAESPLLVASFPLPRLQRVVGRFLGDQLSHLPTLEHCSRVELCKTRLRLDDYEQLQPTDEPKDWLSCRVLGSWQAVDAFMDGAFYLLSPGDVSAAGLAARLHEFEREKAAAGTQPPQLFALTCRGLQLPAGALELLSSPHHRAAAAPPPPSLSALSDSAFSPTSGAAPSLPSPVPEQMALGPDWADVLLSDMAHRGLSFGCRAEVPEFAHSASPCLCSAEDAVFACLPLPARQSVRDVFCYEDLQEAPSIAVIEDRHAVAVDVPRLTDDQGQTRNAEHCPWLHVVISQSSRTTAATAADAARAEWDAALRFVLARYRAACESAQSCAGSQ